MTNGTDIVEEMCGDPTEEKDYYTKQEIESALDQMERRIDMKASRLIAMQRDALYSKDEIDELVEALTGLIHADMYCSDRPACTSCTDKLRRFRSRFLP